MPENPSTGLFAMDDVELAVGDSNLEYPAHAELRIQEPSTDTLGYTGKFQLKVGENIKKHGYPVTILLDGAQCLRLGHKLSELGRFSEAYKKRNLELELKRLLTENEQLKEKLECAPKSAIEGH